VRAIRDDIAEYEKLKTRLEFASGEEATRIELQKSGKVAAIRELKKELFEKGNAGAWNEFVSWEQSL